MIWKASLLEPEAAQHQVQPFNTESRLVYSRDDASRGTEQTSATSSILIVEDDYLIAMQAEDALSEAGFDVLGVAASADQAVEMARADRPVLAIMDIRLVGKRDGVEAALELFRTQNIRCIFATAHADQDVVSRARPAQPLAWLQKPYTIPSLIAAVRNALEELASQGH